MIFKVPPNQNHSTVPQPLPCLAYTGDSSQSAVLKTKRLFLSSCSTSWAVPSSWDEFCKWL